jgi:hypothetical protein
MLFLFSHFFFRVQTGSDNSAAGHVQSSSGPKNTLTVVLNESHQQRLLKTLTTPVPTSSTRTTQTITNWITQPYATFEF